MKKYLTILPIFLPLLCNAEGVQPELLQRTNAFEVNKSTPDTRLAPPPLSVAELNQKQIGMLIPTLPPDTAFLNNIEVISISSKYAQIRHSIPNSTIGIRTVFLNNAKKYYFNNHNYSVGIKDGILTLKETVNNPLLGVNQGKVTVEQVVFESGVGLPAYIQAKIVNETPVVVNNAGIGVGQKIKK